MRLDNIAETLKTYPNTRLALSAHTDSQGNAKINKDLSIRRARAVANYLVNEGVDSSRLSARGYGAIQPVQSNETLEGRHANRRVVVRIAN